MFASFLHSHLLGEYIVHYFDSLYIILIPFTITGTGMTVKHFRKVNDTACNAVEELEPIDSNPSYDFDFQQLNHLQRRVHVKKVSKKYTMQIAGSCIIIHHYNRVTPSHWSAITEALDVQ